MEHGGVIFCASICAICAVAIDAILIWFKNIKERREKHIKEIEAALVAADVLADKTASFLAKLGTKKETVAEAIEEYQNARKEVEK